MSHKQTKVLKTIENKNEAREQFKKNKQASIVAQPVVEKVQKVDKPSSLTQKKKSKYEDKVINSDMLDAYRVDLDKNKDKKDPTQNDVDFL